MRQPDFRLRYAKAQRSRETAAEQVLLPEQASLINLRSFALPKPRLTGRALTCRPPSSQERNTRPVAGGPPFARLGRGR